MDLSIGTPQEIGDHFRALLLGISGLEVEGGVLLVALSGKADVIELYFVNSGLGYELGECNVIILDCGVRGVGPDELAVFTPGLPGAVRLYGEIRMGGDEMLVAKDCDASDGVH